MTIFINQKINGKIVKALVSQIEYLEEKGIEYNNLNEKKSNNFKTESNVVTELEIHCTGASKLEGKFQVRFYNNI